jgi:hypothetical protein
MVLKLALSVVDPASHKFGSVNPNVLPNVLPLVHPVAGLMLQIAGLFALHEPLDASYPTDVFVKLALVFTHIVELGVMLKDATGAVDT